MTVVLAAIGLLAFAWGIYAQEAPASGSNAQLDEIVKKQSDILQKLDEIKAELEIIKVRVTLNG